MMKAEVMKKQIPNLITGVRIIGAISLLFIETFSLAFYIVYTLSGISDAIDGWIARKMKITSEIGAKLDSLADILFYAVMLIKIFPVLWVKLPGGIWFAVGGILFLRVCSYGVAAWKYGSFASLHTYMNKLTGGAVFIVPYVIAFSVFVRFCITVCVIAAVATVEELLIHISGKGQHSNIKTIWEC